MKADNLNINKDNLINKQNVGFKIAVLSSFTFSGIKDALNKECQKINFSPEFYIGKYNQYIQEILNKDGQLYKFNPDLIIFFVDAKTLMGDLFFLPYQISDEERKKWVEEETINLTKLISVLLEETKANIILHNFEVPTYSPLGILENKQELGFIESIEKLNEDLKNAYKNNNRVFVFDYNGFCSRVGKDNIVDPKMYYLGDIKLAIKHLPALCHEYLFYIKPILSLSKKCIVLDLDNTLWGGIVGEDGMEGIKLGPTPEGKPFWEFQKHLLSLYKRGILLAINSKNNPGDALKVLREHPYMVLKEEYFLSQKINWTDKATNMKEIAKELNIGIDSLVFIDDDKANREMIKEFLPEVQVVDLPEDPALYSETLFRINDFSLLQLTGEDKKKGEMYATEKKREQLKTSVQSLDEFLKYLELKITIIDADKFTIPRISQLTQKTNQFNLTTRRYEEKQIEEFVNSNKYMVRCYQVGDKFGDYGITGVVIVKKEDKNWNIDTFLLSCRVLGKNIEFAIMDSIIGWVKEQKMEKIFAEFIPTPKNKPAENLYKDCNFREVERKNDGSIYYVFDVAGDNYSYPNYINIQQA